MKLSIIVPCYNTAVYLRRCLDSILAQTYTEFELLIVDDGSTDGSQEICDEYCGADGRVSVIHQGNMGLVYSRKVGIKAASGDYILFVDSDDWIEEDYIANIMSAADNGKHDIVVVGASKDYEGEIIKQKNQMTAGDYSDRELQLLYGKMLCCRDYFVMGVLPYVWNKLIKRDIYSKISDDVPNDIRVGEDVAFIIPAFLNASSIKIIEEYGYHYCIRCDSMMSPHSLEKELLNVKKLYLHLLSVMEKYAGKGVLEQQIKRYTIHNMLTRCYPMVEKCFAEDRLFPFEGAVSGRKIAVYGAGALGRAVYSRICGCDAFAQIQWIDKAANVYSKMGLPIVSLDDASDLKDSYVVIAILDMTVSKKVRQNLIKGFGVHEDAISIINIIDKEKALLDYMKDFRM